MNRAFWQQRRVLVTGHTGFKGSWLSLWLQSMGCQVIGYALPAPTRPSLFEVARVGVGMESLEGDVRDLAHLQRVMRRHRPEVVFHLAAQPLVRHSYRDPVETYATNVMGTVNVLEAIRHVDEVRAVVNVTTDKCYENREWIWAYRENEPLGGLDPYSSSKACSELVTQAYRASYFGNQSAPRIATARAGNVIGGGDWAADRLVPDLVRGLMAGEPALIRHPAAIRPWQHVLDPLHGYLMLAEQLGTSGTDTAEAWNFGPDEAVSVAWLVEEVAKQWGGAVDWSLDSGAHPHEAALLKLDSSKAKARLGWQTLLAPVTAVEWTTDWYKAAQEGGDMQAYTLEQISAFARRRGPLEPLLPSGGRLRGNTD